MIWKIKSGHGRISENENFENVSDENCIAHEFSAPSTPQQNGFLERKLFPSRKGSNHVACTFFANLILGWSGFVAC